MRIAVIAYNTFSTYLHRLYYNHKIISILLKIKRDGWLNIKSHNFLGQNESCRKNKNKKFVTYTDYEYPYYIYEYQLYYIYTRNVILQCPSVHYGSLKYSEDYAKFE